MNNYTIIGGELYHYGVPGMKWGQRNSIVSTQKRKPPKWAKVEVPEKGPTYGSTEWYEQRFEKARKAGQKTREAINKMKNKNKNTDVKAKTSNGKKVAKGILAAGIGVASVASISKFLLEKDPIAGVSRAEIIKTAIQMIKIK